MENGLDGVEIRPLTASDLDGLEPLWKALLDRIRLPGQVVTIVPHEESWPRRKADYEDLLRDGESFGLAAFRGDDAIGYAMVHVDEPDPVWATGERYVELTSLSVLPAERRRGVGTALLDALERELISRGVRDLVIGVDTVNQDAQRFYERRGFRVGYHLMHGRLGKVARYSMETESVGQGEKLATVDEGSPETAAHGEA